MRALAKSLFAVSLLAASAVRADDGPDDFYIGVGMFNDMANINMEFVTEDWGNIVVRLGQFQGLKEGVAGNISVRKPLTSDNPKESGYFIGVFAGQVVGDALGGETFNRLGGGGELGYHWVNDYTRKVLSVGIGAAEPVEAGGKKSKAEPTIFFEFSIGLGY
ncbi:MAG: hypothetical protein Q8J78_02585, partial [Moraxellaceae bacterium]|nr:hypothetical protein [Moraxellaceae bacterium]